MDMVKIIGKTIANIIAPAEMPHAIAGLYICYIASPPTMTGLSRNSYPSVWMLIVEQVLIRSIFTKET